MHPLFGVIAGRKFREACYVALERYNNLIIKSTMDLIKVAEEAFATGKKFPEFKAGDTVTVLTKLSRVLRSVSSSIVVWSSRSLVTVTRSASLFARCQVPLV